MEKLLIIAINFLLLTSVASASNNFEKYIRINAESGNELIEKQIKKLKNKLSVIKSNSDLRISHNMVILETSKNIGCDFKKIILSPTQEILNNSVRDLMQIRVCGEPIGSVILDRAGNNLTQLSQFKKLKILKCRANFIKTI